MTYRSRLTIKSIAVILLFAFAFSEVSHAASMDGAVAASVFSSAQDKLVKDPSLFQVPLEFSRLLETHAGNKDRLILHIQDAHSNLSGQDNLAKTLDEIMAKYDVSLILVEGGSKDDTLTPIK